MDPTTRICTWRCACNFDRKLVMAILQQVELTCEHCGQKVIFMVEASGKIHEWHSTPGMVLTIAHPAPAKPPEPGRSVWERINSDDDEDDPV